MRNGLLCNFGIGFRDLTKDCRLTAMLSWVSIENKKISSLLVALFLSIDRYMEAAGKHRSHPGGSRRVHLK